MDTWEQIFERVLVPVAGLAGVIYAGLGGPVPGALYPVLLGLIGYPIARQYDRWRRNGTEELEVAPLPPPLPPKRKPRKRKPTT